MDRSKKRGKNKKKKKKTSTHVERSNKISLLRELNNILNEDLNVGETYVGMYAGIIGCPLLSEGLRMSVKEICKNVFVEQRIKEEIIWHAYFNCAWDIERHKRFYTSE